MEKRKPGEQAAPDETRQTADAQDGPEQTPGAGDTAAGQTEKAEAREKKQKGPTELDLLKQCLSQALEDGKKLAREKDELKHSLNEKETLLNKLNTRLRQVVDEYDNYRRRAAEEKKSAYADAVCKAVSALLPALDSLERALPFAEQNPDSFRQGVEMTLKQLKGGFEKLGVEEIDTPVGGTFDPDVHNAVMHVEDDSAGESVVAEVFQKGYKVEGKVIRHSVVKVAN